MTQSQLTSDFPQLAGVRHRFVDLPGLRMHVAEAGSGEPVLLLHGFPQHWWEWRGVIPGLAERYHVIAPDLRGSGWTDAPPAGYTRNQLRDDVVALLDELELGSVRVISHDMGALVGFALCLDHPERVARHVSLGGPPPFVSFSPRLIPAFRHLWFQQALAMPGLGRRLLSGGRQRLPRHLFTHFTPEPEVWSADDLDVFVSRLRDPSRADAGSALYRKLVLAELPRMLRGAYDRQRLETSTLLLFGAADAAFPPDLVRILLRGSADHVDDMDLVFVEGAAHFIADEKPNEVVARSLAFFADSP
jgi:pimeloyl-ACP methyl ester carboxylesterase